MQQVNPIQLIQMIRNGQNPQQLMMYVLQSQGYANTPMGANLMEMVKNGNSQGIEQIARNIVQSRGLDFDKEFTAFRQQLGV